MLPSIGDWISHKKKDSAGTIFESGEPTAVTFPALPIVHEQPKFEPIVPCRTLKLCFQFNLAQMRV